MYKRNYPTKDDPNREQTDLARPPGGASPGAMKQRTELAYEMWRAGKRAAEIGEMLQVSTARVRQLIHRQAWAMRHPAGL
jgi:hypothetical protein